MMRTLRRVLVGAAIVVVVLAGIGLLLPREVQVERSIVVQAPPAQVFELVNGFQRFNEYSPWFERDPQARYTYAGPDSGVGARMSWASDREEVGSGAQEIVASEPPRLVRNKLEFGDEDGAFAVWTIEPVAEGSRVTWALESDLGMNPVMRYMGLAFERLIGPDYEQGLAKLKAVAEAGSPPAEDSTTPADGTTPAGDAEATPST